MNLELFCLIQKFFFVYTDSEPWIAPLLILMFIAVTPLWFYIAARNPFTKAVLDYGWTPVILAMLISR